MGTPLNQDDRRSAWSESDVPPPPEAWSPHVSASPRPWLIAGVLLAALFVVALLIARACA